MRILCQPASNRKVADGLKSRYVINMLERLGLTFEEWVRKNMPEPFVLVLLLTGITWIFSAAIAPHADHLQLLPGYWFKGFGELLSFSMQMVLIVVTGEAIIATRPIRRLFDWISDQPKTPPQALWLLTSISLALGWIHWGFGLIGSALLAKEMALVLRRKWIRVDYPLMGAAAYMSMLLWHAGTTASAPLLINTPGHFLEKTIGLIPLKETIFLPSNLIVCLILFLAVPWIIVKMHPKTPRTVEKYIISDSELAVEYKTPKLTTFAERLDHNPWLGRAIGTLGMSAFLIMARVTHSFSLTHNSVNFILVMVGLTLHGAPTSYARAIAGSVRGTSGIILQYPFYGGIMGLMEGSGLGHLIAGGFVRMASSHTLPFFAYLASVVTKLFVPSGGGEWAVEGPVMLKAAHEIGAAVGKTTMGVAYGNMVGNLFQPFWAIPLLAVLGLRARDIMGFCLVVFLFAFPLLGLALLLS